jgi:hypothetical protein
MALVVEDGTGKTNADSYLSLTDADAYHLIHSVSAAWASATEAVKEKALRLATQYLDVRYNGLWKSYRTNETQALAWPRAYVQDSDGYYLDSDEMPQRLKDATAELALRVVEGDTLLDDISKPGVISSSSISVGPISKSITYSGGYNQVKKYPLIDGLVKQFISTGTLERG